jgi:hypothetical protein
MWWPSQRAAARRRSAERKRRAEVGLNGGPGLNADSNSAKAESWGKVCSTFVQNSLPLYSDVRAVKVGRPTDGNASPLSLCSRHASRMNSSRMNLWTPSKNRSGIWISCEHGR